MKQILPVFLFFPLIVLAQDSTKVRSHLEEFAAGSAALTRWDQWNLGKFKNLFIYKFTITNVLTNDSTSALQFVARSKFFDAFSGDYLYFGNSIIIDYSDLPDLNKALQFANNNIINKACLSGCPTVSYQYTTVSGVRFNFINIPTGEGGWNFFISRVGVANTTLQIQGDDFGKLMKLFNQETANFQSSKIKL